MSMRCYPVIIAFALSLSVVGCGRTKSAFMTIQFCVHDRAGAAELVSDLKDIASLKHIKFSDSSTSTANDLQASGNRARERID